MVVKVKLPVQYIVSKETKRQLIRIESGKRVLKFEKRIREKSDNKILIEYLMETERNWENKMRWELEREMYWVWE